MRKGRIDVGLKQCKKCHKEFSEKENYKWSCKMHTSGYNERDDLWWCCGSKGKNRIGCITGKHESKDDEEDEDEERDKNQNNHHNMRCMCCKEIGHLIENCPRDPNMKQTSLTQINVDYERILKIKDNKKLFIDSAVTTTHFMKKCIKVPKYEQYTQENMEGFSAREIKELEKQQFNDNF